MSQGFSRKPGASAHSSFAYFPSEWRWEERIPLPGSAGPTTAAPAPSPKITATSRPAVEKSSPVLWTSAPMTRTWSWNPPLTYASATERP